MIDDIDPNLFKLKVNYTWKSPSYASAFVAGGDDNGRISWCSNGKTLVELEIEYEQRGNED